MTELHEFVPLPVTAQDHRDGRPCNGRCFCAAPGCGQRKSDRAVHLQPRDRRRPK